jgi:hypothetical protein
MHTSLLLECEAIVKYITAAREIVQSGHMPDLNGLDGRVAALCAALMKADKITQQQCLPQLNAILETLDTCEVEMRALHQAPQKGKA